MLSAPRFAGQPTLEACVAEGYRMFAGEQDADAVLRLQKALHDLGYFHEEFIGTFGPKTGEAVSAFKTEEALRPTDPVASVGTIGRLDSYFAHEPADPDAGDPSENGVLEAVAGAALRAGPWADAALRDVTMFDPDDERPGDQQWEALGRLLESHFHFSRAGLTRGAALREWIIPVFEHAASVLAEGALEMTVVPMSRAAFLTAHPGIDYLAYRPASVGVVEFTPAFRTGLAPDDQAATVFSLIARGHDERLGVYAFPETKHFEFLPGEQGIRNAFAYAYFAYGSATGQGTSDIRPHARWPR